MAASPRSDAMRRRLDAVIASKGYKLTKLSVDIGRHRDYIGNIIRGKAKPSLEVLLEIANKLEIDPVYLFEESEGETPHSEADLSILAEQMDVVIETLTDQRILEQLEEQLKLKKSNAAKKRRLAARIQDIPQTKLSIEAHETLARIGDLGYAIVNNIPHREGIDLDMFSTHSPNWGFEYVSNRLAEKDATLVFMNTRGGVITWKQLKEETEDTEVFDRAQKHGLEHGTVITSAYRGKKIAVSLSHSKPELDEEEIRLASNAILRFLILMTPAAPSKDPYELLYFNANGMTNKDLRSSLDYNSRQLASLRTEALSLMEAKTLEQAIANAQNTGIL